MFGNIPHLEYVGVSLVAQKVKNLPAMRDTQVQSLGLEKPLEKGMATHFSIPAWRTTRTDEVGGLHSMGLQSHDLATFSRICYPIVA